MTELCTKLKFGLKFSVCKNNIDKSLFFEEINKVHPFVNGIPNLTKHEYGVDQDDTNIFLYTPAYEAESVIDIKKIYNKDLRKLFSFLSELFYMDYHCRITLVIKQSTQDHFERVKYLQGSIFDQYEHKKTVNIFTFNPVKYGFTTFYTEFQYDLLCRILYCIEISHLDIPIHDMNYMNPYYKISLPIKNHFTLKDYFTGKNP